MRRVMFPVIFCGLFMHAGAQAQPLPQAKTGQCPNGYTQSGNYCAPTSKKSCPAIPKTGQCPSGWAQSGGYCQQMNC